MKSGELKSGELKSGELKAGLKQESKGEAKGETKRGGSPKWWRKPSPEEKNTSSKEIVGKRSSKEDAGNKGLGKEGKSEKEGKKKKWWM